MLQKSNQTSQYMKTSYKIYLFFISLFFLGLDVAAQVDSPGDEDDNSDLEGPDVPISGTFNIVLMLLIAISYGFYVYQKRKTIETIERKKDNSA
jgi:hypothetical protein